MKNGVTELKNADSVERFGGKAANLAKMLRAGLPVPNGLAVELNAFEKSGKLKDETVQEINKLLTTNKLYAVRSSALAEDAEGASWAGQFETFLDTKSADIVSKIEECHNSTKTRAKAYASDKGKNTFNIAVVVQEMIKPEYAGVLFTKEPVSGADKLVTEYIKGIGEELVSGRADPSRLVLTSGEKINTPFDANILADLAHRVENLFGSPQDIEWAWADGKMWLVQARPITTTQGEGKGYYLGEPDELFYWGPSRAKPMYMDDFMSAAEHFFILAASDPSLPTPPKTLVLFCRGKMVWLSNSDHFNNFTESIFLAYEKRNRLDKDIWCWQKATKNNNDIKEAWDHTLFAEFSLYGAESVLIKKLRRFDVITRQKIWGAFTSPDNSTFLDRIDKELLKTHSPDDAAKKYPWIEDGYNGTSDKAINYFTERLKILERNPGNRTEQKQDRKALAKKFSLTTDEIRALNLARELADFMDKRKAWMMQTRRSIIKTTGNFQNGWFYNEGQSSTLDAKTADELWERYVDFKVSSAVVKGIVASNGGRHFINGEVSVIFGPTDTVADDRILVVPSTSPSYVPLMRKARALVTDHGGMMSHAAIVAREFGLPCIVGTKQATKVLQDNDKVVLDLVKGIVNK